MQGLSILTDPQGNPKTAMIDLQQHDNQLNPLVAGLLDLLTQQQEDHERREFLEASMLNLNRAYGDDEPEYTDAHLIERNPNYQPK